eukprot:gnl/MRDRNA2_/MRDRNA2_85076_c0_seq1.p1 gnl/MRDRNA2_/MRDRNA2_85076_c0~~gnl/MRDRNA2_/MRDRNA2_85076_c0_seq1.p1  ORF type:complete len:1034 (-),score=177.09 gnl/MRDRNA2_/MRDRNA2_85076_c0_seq1:87-3188(-)
MINAKSGGLSNGAAPSVPANGKGKAAEITPLPLESLSGPPFQMTKDMRRAAGKGVGKAARPPLPPQKQGLGKGVSPMLPPQRKGTVPPTSSRSVASRTNLPLGRRFHARDIGEVQVSGCSAVTELTVWESLLTSPRRKSVLEEIPALTRYFSKEKPLDNKQKLISMKWQPWECLPQQTAMKCEIMMKTLPIRGEALAGLLQQLDSENMDTGQVAVALERLNEVLTPEVVQPLLRFDGPSENLRDIEREILPLVRLPRFEPRLRILLISQSLQAKQESLMQQCLWLQHACTELRASPTLRAILARVLVMFNFVNFGVTESRESRIFDISALLNLHEFKTNNGPFPKFHALHWIVLQLLADGDKNADTEWHLRELPTLSKAASNRLSDIKSSIDDLRSCVDFIRNEKRNHSTDYGGTKSRCVSPSPDMRFHAIKDHDREPEEALEQSEALSTCAATNCDNGPRNFMVSRPDFIFSQPSTRAHAWLQKQLEKLFKLVSFVEVPGPLLHDHDQCVERGQPGILRLPHRFSLGVAPEEDKPQLAQMLLHRIAEVPGAGKLYRGVQRFSRIILPAKMLRIPSTPGADMLYRGIHRGSRMLHQHWVLSTDREVDDAKDDQHVFPEYRRAVQKLWRRPARGVMEVVDLFARTFGAHGCSSDAKSEAVYQPATSKLDLAPWEEETETSSLSTSSNTVPRGASDMTMDSFRSHTEKDFKDCLSEDEIEDDQQFRNLKEILLRSEAALSTLDIAFSASKDEAQRLMVFFSHCMPDGSLPRLSENCSQFLGTIHAFTRFSRTSFMDVEQYRLKCKRLGRQDPVDVLRGRDNLSGMSADMWHTQRKQPAWQERLLAKKHAKKYLYVMYNGCVARAVDCKTEEFIAHKVIQEGLDYENISNLADTEASTSPASEQFMVAPDNLADTDDAAEKQCIIAIEASEVAVCRIRFSYLHKMGFRRESRDNLENAIAIWKAKVEQQATGVLHQQEADISKQISYAEQMAQEQEALIENSEKEAQLDAKEHAEKNAQAEDELHFLSRSCIFYGF